MMAQVIKEILLDHKKFIELVTDCFKEIDEDGSGEIDFIELRDFLIKFVASFTKNTPTQEDIEELMANYDNDGKNTLNLNDFYILIKDLLYALLEVNIADSDEKIKSDPNNNSI